ncbi:hypothetical protein GCM10023321_63420 [Pseudonocardia eucalypti]|uniref:Uncharacterized protein n=1 Tax=Pseudonocardia eucalypti TaxID=648755 RepID=A0ABP9QWL6_9PSEU|nr:hypothetical protein [Pseudonocardia eucalypti]
MSSVDYRLIDGLAVLTISHDRAPVLGNDLMSQLGVTRGAREFMADPSPVEFRGE